MGVGTVHANIAGELVSQLRVYRVPMIMLLIDGKVVHMSESIRVETIRLFVRKSLPADLVQNVSIEKAFTMYTAANFKLSCRFFQLKDDNYAEFLSGWPDNKARTVFFDSQPEPSLRFLVPAFANRDRFSAGYVHTNK